MGLDWLIIIKVDWMRVVPGWKVIASMLIIPAIILRFFWNLP